MSEKCTICNANIQVDPITHVIGRHAQGETPDLCPMSGSIFYAGTRGMNEVPEPQVKRPIPNMGFPPKERNGFSR